MGDVTIRPASMEDLPAVIAMLEEVDELHRIALPWLFRKVDEPRAAGFLEEFVAKQDRAMLLATTSAGALAGVLYMFLRQGARAPLVVPAIVAEIDALVVGRAWRRRGVGKCLVQAALRWATDHGATRTELGVYEFNESARRFWESVGFHTLSRRLVAHARGSADV